jgi:hypothetical protein
MIAWKYVTEYGWDGDMLHELDAGFVEKRKFSAIEITRASDLDSNLLQHGTNEQQEGTQCKLFGRIDSELD